MGANAMLKKQYITFGFLQGQIEPPMTPPTDALKIGFRQLVKIKYKNAMTELPISLMPNSSNLKSQNTVSVSYNHSRIISINNSMKKKATMAIGAQIIQRKMFMSINSRLQSRNSSEHHI